LPEKLPRKGLEGCEAATARSAEAGAKRSPGKPGFRRFAPEMRPDHSENIFAKIKLPARGRFNFFTHQPRKGGDEKKTG
jgi:hypothetical protein